jgi:hypothetical protein
MRWNNSKPLVVGHDGATIGQFAFLRMVPECGFAVALLTNGGQAAALWRSIAGPLLQTSCGVALPPLAAPTDAAFDAAAYVGRYKKLSARVDVQAGEGGRLSAVVTPRGAPGFAQTFALRYVRDNIFAAELDGLPAAPFVFGAQGLHMGLRLYPRA